MRRTVVRGVQQAVWSPSRMRRAVALDDEHLPHVAVGILDPDLVLDRVAARGVLFGAGLEPVALEPLRRERDVLGGRDLDAEVTRVDARARAPPASRG